MMGRTHAASGALTGLGVAALAPVWGETLDPLHVVAIVGIAAGAALLPDLDHPQATVSRALGPLTVALAVAVQNATGGHREGTHSLIGVAAFTAISWAITAVGGLPLGLWLAFLFAVASASLMIRVARLPILHTITCLAAGAGLVTLAGVTPMPGPAVVIATAAGVTTHLVGDLITPDGCPLLWPARARIALPLIVTGGLLERWLIAPLLIAGVAVAGVSLAPPHALISDAAAVAGQVIQLLTH